MGYLRHVISVKALCRRIHSIYLKRLLENNLYFFIVLQVCVYALFFQEHVNGLLFLFCLFSFCFVFLLRYNCLRLSTSSWTVVLFLFRRDINCYADFAAWLWKGKRLESNDTNNSSWLEYKLRDNYKMVSLFKWGWSSSAGNAFPLDLWHWFQINIFCSYALLGFTCFNSYLKLDYRFILVFWSMLISYLMTKWSN